MQRVDDYILRLPEKEKEIHILLREFIHEIIPDVSEKMAYGLPFFYLKKPFCYIHLHQGGVDISFMNANLMKIQKKHLDMRDRARVGSLHYKEVFDIDIDILKNVLLEAASLDPSANK